MELHRQKCQACGSRTMINHIVRESGESDKIFAQCAECGQLVARYTIAQRGYYHHGKGYESYLRGLNRGGCHESARELMEGFDQIKAKVTEEFEAVLARRAEKEAARRGDDQPEGQ